MEYKIVQLTNNDGNPETDQFGNAILRIFVGNELVGTVVYPEDIAGAKEQAVAQLESAYKAYASSIDNSSEKVIANQLRDIYLSRVSESMEVQVPVLNKENNLI